MSVNIYKKETGELIQIAGNANGVIDDANVSNKTTYSSEKIEELIESINNNIITVKKDGTGDFTQIIQAVKSIKNASPSNRYTIKVNDGIYDIYEEIGGYDFISKVNSNTGNMDIGVCLPQYVDLIGVGNVTLEFLPEADKMTDIAVSKVSPLNLVGNNTIENITIKCKNCRYAVHDETGGLSDYYNGVHIFKDCTFIHHGKTGNFSWGQTNAYACGFDVGNIYKFENCNFISSGFGNACSFHDRVSNTVPTSIDFNNCNFTSLSGVSLRFGTVSTGNKHKVNILNCNFSDGIELNEETTGSGVGIGFVVKGSGNNIVPHVITNTKKNDNELHYPVFVNEKTIITCRNEITKLTKNTAYAYNQKGSAYPTRATGNRFDFITLEDIKSFGFGLVFKHGYIQESILNLSTNIGDYIYFENGQFLTNGTNKIGENDGMREGYVLIY